MRLSGNTILITGATSGIGRAFAEAFQREGSTVIATGRRADRLAELERTLPGIRTRVVDIAAAGEREDLAEWASSEFPQVNMLMNNAGIQLAMDLTKSVDLANVESEIETNLVAPIHLASLLAPHLSKQSEAAIINITSGLAFAPLAIVPVYCATKAAMHSYSLTLRHQLRMTSVKVFEIAPPSVDTELGHQRRADKSQSHGGMPIAEFLEEAMQAIADDLYEAPITGAKMLRAKREEIFGTMNSRF